MSQMLHGEHKYFPVFFLDVLNIFKAKKEKIEKNDEPLIACLLWFTKENENDTIFLSRVFDVPC